MEQSSATMASNSAQYSSSGETSSDSSPAADSAYCSEYESTPAEQENPPSQLSKKITAILLDEELWQSFNRIGNEMIVTKPGRRLFPAPLVTLRGLNPSKDYNITLRVASVDTCRYRFFNMQWTVVGESEVYQNEARQMYIHPSSPRSGEFWMKRPISFRTVKITHNPSSKNGNILLHTMHKYVLEIVVSPTDGSAAATTVRLEDTAFIAVSSYQNTNLTQQKIENNPFAKGFRDKFRTTVSPSVLTPYSCGLSFLPFYTAEGTLLQTQEGQTSSAPSSSTPNTISLSMVPIHPFFANAVPPSHHTPVYSTSQGCASPTLASLSRPQDTPTSTEK